MLSPSGSRGRWPILHRARHFLALVSAGLGLNDAGMFALLFHRSARSTSAVCLLATCALLLPTGRSAERPAANADWPTYLGDKQRSLYSPLKQIDRSNVAQLKAAWTYETGDKAEYQANNLIIGGVLYTASPTRKVIALDAATGKELWKWDPVSERKEPGRSRQRGLVWWQNEEGGEQRIFTAVGELSLCARSEGWDADPQLWREGLVASRQRAG